LGNARMRFESARNNCNTAVTSSVEEARSRLGLAAASLDALSPLAVLQRGYAIAEQENGQLLRDSAAISVGDPMRVRLAKGMLDARVERIQTNEE